MTQPGQVIRPKPADRRYDIRGERFRSISEAASLRLEIGIRESRSHTGPALHHDPAAFLDETGGNVGRESNAPLPLRHFTGDSNG